MRRYIFTIIVGLMLFVEGKPALAVAPIAAVLAPVSTLKEEEAISRPELIEAATDSAKIEMTAEPIVKKVVKKEPDITEPEPEIKGKLERYLAENLPGPLGPFNFIQYSILHGVSRGVPANTVVLILLFPLVATIVVIARHIIGLKSFGIFTPALLAVAFLATGLTKGLFLLGVIILAAMLARIILRKIHFQYLPRMAIFMWFITMSIFSTLLVSPVIGVEGLATIGIFPILILILFIEDFIDVQITRSFYQAVMITLETLVVAITSYLFVNLEVLQKFVLVNPEIFMVILLLLIVLVERYSGLRLMEIWRFRKLLK